MKEKRGNPLVYLFQKTWHYSEGNRRSVALFWGMLIVANSLARFTVPFIWAKVIDIITKQGIVSDNIRTLLYLISATLIIEVLFWSLHGPARVLENLNAFKARSNYRKYLLKGVMSLPLSWHVEHHSGDTIDKVEKGANALFYFSEDSFEIIYGFVKLIGSYAMLIYFSRSSAFIVLFMILVTVWITMRFDRVLIDQYKELNHSENKISESIFDYISKIMTIIILRSEKLILKALANRIDSPYHLFKKNVCLNEVKWCLTSICCTTMTILVLGTYFMQNINSPAGVMVSQVYLLINYLDKISELFFQFTRMYGDILQRRAKVMNSEELAIDFVPENMSNHVLPEKWQTIKVSHLDFSYHDDNRGELNLTDISLEIGHGQKIAFVGKTGSGKTTLLKIIRGLYRPRNIVLEVDGKTIEDGFSGICSAISLVPQDPEIFATTIANNITLGAEYDMDTVRRFSDMAHFTEVAEALPKKFEASVREKGVKFSGGENQRLAMARGLLASQDKDIVLLDEPTKSLDPFVERRIYENIFLAMNGQTIISTLHSLHLLPLFDKIYFFHKGKIVGQGSLEELLTTCPEFRTLWAKSQHKRQ